MLFFKYLWLIILIGIYLVWTINTFLIKRDNPSWYLWWINYGIYWLFVTLGVTFTSSLMYFIVTFVD